jgi:hypothetical protein
VQPLPEADPPLADSAIAQKRGEEAIVGPPPPLAAPLQAEPKATAAYAVREDVDGYKTVPVSPRMMFQSQLGTERAVVAQTVEVAPAERRFRNPFKLGRAKVAPAPPSPPPNVANPAIRVTVHISGRLPDLDWRAISSSESQSLAVRVDTVAPGYIAILERSTDGSERTLAPGSGVTLARDSVRVALTSIAGQRQITVIYSPRPLTPARLTEISQGSTSTGHSEETHSGSEHAVYAGAAGPARELVVRLTVE